MNKFLMSVVAAMTVATPATVLADHHMSMNANPVDLYSCTLKEGKDMDDVMEVNKKWQKWAAANDPSQSAWMMVPQYQGGDGEMDLAYLGAWGSGAAQGAGLDKWSKAALQEDFGEVISCSHVLVASVPIQTEGWEPGDGVVWFARCTLEDGATMSQAIAAHAQSAAAMKELAQNDSSTWAFIPALGFVDAKFDYYGVAAWPNYVEFGKGFDAYFNAGGWKKMNEAMAGVTSCASPNVYDTMLMQAGTPGQ